MEIFGGLVSFRQAAMALIGQDSEQPEVVPIISDNYKSFT
jgi:hypothetical protein